MKKILLPIYALLLTTSMAFAQNVNITFELNAATLGGNIDPAGLYIAGGTGFGVPGDHQLTDPNNDGIYTITISKPANFSSHYTFLNGSCGDWSCKENLAGLTCADPANWNDRWLPAVTADTTIKACFGTCDSDGGCTIVTDSIDITFELNSSSIATIDPAGLFLAGGGNFGVPGDNPMMDPNNDGIYTITVRKPKGFESYYTFTNGACASDWSCKEDLAGLACGDSLNYNDRKLPAVYSDTTVQVCFGTCDSDGSCASVNTNRLEVDKNLFTLQPSLVSNYTTLIFNDNVVNKEKQVSVINAVGQVVYSTLVNNTNTYQLDATKYANGMYFITVSTEQTMLTQRFVIAK